MGWLSTYGQSRAELIRNRTKTYFLWNKKNPETGNYEENPLMRGRTIRHCTVGNNLWKVNVIEQRGSADSEEWEEVSRFIGLDLMQKFREGWGYKDLDESCGPCEVSCPLAYLDLVPEPDSEYAKAWRKRVHEYHANRARASSLTDGTVIRFRSPLSFGGYGQEDSFKVVKRGRRLGFYAVHLRLPVSLRANTLQNTDWEVVSA